MSKVLEYLLEEKEKELLEVKERVKEHYFEKQSMASEMVRMKAEVHKIGGREVALKAANKKLSERNKNLRKDIHECSKIIKRVTGLSWKDDWKKMASIRANLEDDV